MINGYLYSLEEDGLYKFNGSGFIKVLNIEQTIFGKIGVFNQFEGGSENNLLIEAPYGDLYERGLYHWNGKKWSKEVINISSYFNIAYFSEGQYLLFRSDWLNAYVYRGIQKSKFK